MANAVISALDARRQAEDIWTLSDRLGLWSYLIDTVTSSGPWFGLGYFAASRVYAPEYNPGLGTAHSAFIEVYVGGGLISFAIFMCIWAVTAFQVWRIYVSRPDKLGFAFVALFCAAFFLNAIGGELQADPAGFCFWAIVAGLSAMTSKSLQNQPVLNA
jgi:O-antigen ligase